MIEIVDGKLNQWDVKREVEVTGKATHVHFANPGDSRAVKMPIEKGKSKIPEYLLQTGKALNVYAVSNGVTLESRSFAVRKRERPEDYIYDDDQRNYIYELIDEANDAIKNANDAAEEAREAAEKCIGGGGKVLNVWVEGDEADHTSSEIYDHVSNNRGPVQLHCDGGYYPLIHVEDYGSAYFGYIADENYLRAVILYGSSVERYDHWFESQDNVDYKINRAIDDLVKTVNGVTPDENGNVEIGDIGGGNNIFYVDVSETSTGGAKLNTEWSDILDAYDKKRVLICRYYALYGGASYNLLSYMAKYSFEGTAIFIFSGVDRDGATQTITVSQTHKDIPASASYTRVETNLDEKLGDISTALDHIISLQEELIG